MKVFLCATLLILVAGCTGSLCGNEILQEVASPDKQHLAVIFERNCGATTANSKQISVVSFGMKLPNEAGNTFIAKGGGDVRVTWKSADQLTVHHPKNLEIFKAQPNTMGIALKYEQHEPANN